jgi:Tfp pilus assembly protein FimT
MVTVAVLVILSVMAAPSIRQFMAKSEMNALQTDFTAALNRARAEAVSLNTCVSVCQMSATSAQACNANAALDGQWHQGWIIFENPTCAALSATDAANLTAATGIRILAARQARPGRFTLNEKAGATTYLTYNSHGQLRNTPTTFELRDGTLSANAMDICLSMQGRLNWAKVDPVADAAATAAGNGTNTAATKQACTP